MNKNKKTVFFDYYNNIYIFIKNNKESCNFLQYLRKTKTKKQKLKKIFIQKTNIGM